MKLLLLNKRAETILRGVIMNRFVILYAIAVLLTSCATVTQDRSLADS